MASGLNIAAFNVGIAAGAFVGGGIVEEMSLLDTPWIGGLIVLGALALTRWSGWLDQQVENQQTDGTHAEATTLADSR